MGKAKRIIIFDDDDSILEFCKLYFAEKGYEIKTFLSCDDVCERISEFDPQLIIMDCWIPPNGGAKATKLIKANKPLSSIPVIMFSANRDVKKVSNEVGAEAYLEKPFDLNDLDTIVQKLLDN